MMRKLIILCLLGLLSACFGSGEVVPQDQFYQLADIPGDVVQISQPLGIVAVAPLQSDAMHNQRAMLYIEQSSPLKINPYHYHYWSSVPGQILQEYLITYLRKADFAKTVVRYGERQQIDAQITGYIQRFERLLGQGKPKVVVGLELSFISRSAAAPPTLTKVYTAEQETTDNTMEATVLAFSQAVQRIYASFVSDVMAKH